MLNWKHKQETMKKETMMNETLGIEMDTSFLTAGEGLEQFKGNTLSQTYLGIIQPSTAVTLGDATLAGKFRNSNTEEVYGNTVKAVVLSFSPIWSERDKNPPYMTIGRYTPGDPRIRIRKDKLRPGERGFPRMINEDTGNEIQELFAYSIVLVDHPDEGVLFFTPNRSSMSMCRRWNTMLASQRMPGFGNVPIFGYAWDLAATLIANKKTPGTQIGVLADVKRAEFIGKETHTKLIAPNRDTYKDTTLLLQAPLEDELA